MKLKKMLMAVPMIALLSIAATITAKADVGDTDQISRLPYRLDRHYGQVASQDLPNAQIASGMVKGLQLYADADCTKMIYHCMLPNDWAIEWPDSNTICYPLTSASTGADEGRSTTAHYVKWNDKKYIISGTGKFGGTGWDTEKWYRKLPNKISYKSKAVVDGLCSSNGDTIYVANNNGGFKVESDYYYGTFGYYQLEDNYKVIMNAYPTDHCTYDESNYKDAVYSWKCYSQPWSTENLNQGKNTVYYAGMDASGNFATGKRLIKWDTVKPTAAYSPESGEYNSSMTVKISVADKTSGVQKWRYRICSDGTMDTEKWSGYISGSTLSKNVVINTAANNFIVTEVTDNAGNVGTAQSGWYKAANANLSAEIIASGDYYDNTYVTAAVKIHYVNLQPHDLIPSTGIMVKITAGDSVTEQTILCPANDYSYIPFKFKTPPTPGSMTIKVELDPENSLAEINESDNVISKAVIIDSDAYTQAPATYFQPDVPSSFKNERPQSYPSTNTLSWQEWRYESGTLKLKTFSVTASASMTMTPDSRITSNRFDATLNLWTMRSGYGFSNKTTVHVTTNYDRPELITLPQRIRVYFPEFNYSLTNGIRELDKTAQTGTAADYTVTYSFKKNSQSETLQRLHFTPLWFPDGDYTVQENARDLWTPAGQLNMWGTYNIKIDGSVYDDWYAGIVKSD